MKTSYFSSKKLSIYSILGFFLLLVTSCGSYKNTNYSENDGVYGSSENKRTNSSNDDKAQSSKYQEYFSNLNSENDKIGRAHV